MRKKRIIIIACIIGAIIVLMTVFAAMFNLRYLSVEVRYNSQPLEVYGDSLESGIIESGDFAYGSNTLFTSYKESIAKIEKTYPYVKVEKLVRHFPDKMTIYISGRTKEALISHGSSYYVVDVELKVLGVISSSARTNEAYNSLPVVNGLDIGTYEAGDFIGKQSNAKHLVPILDGIYGYLATPSSVMTDITFDISNEKVVITLDNNGADGATISVSGYSYLKQKVFAAYSAYKNTYETDDVNYPDKAVIDLMVGDNFIPDVNETVTIHDRRND